MPLLLRASTACDFAQVHVIPHHNTMAILFLSVTTHAGMASYVGACPVCQTIKEAVYAVWLAWASVAWFRKTLQIERNSRFLGKQSAVKDEFKPASIDTTRPGSLFKSIDNKVTVDFCNNQAGKPKVSFQGNSEDCKELDGIIFFDGNSFRLERLHKAVKSLRHVRLPGESVAAAANINSSAGAVGTGGASAVEPTSSPGHLNGWGAVLAAKVNVEKINPLVQAEELTVGQTETTAEKKTNKRKSDTAAKASNRRTSPPAESPIEAKVSEVQVEMDNEVDERGKKFKAIETSSQPDVKIDEEVVSDFEIEDVDVSEDEDGVNAAEALRAQAAVSQKQKSSSESSGSGSGSGSSSGSSDSGSGSGSSSSGSGSDEEDSASSGDDI